MSYFIYGDYDPAKRNCFFTTGPIFAMRLRPREKLALSLQKLLGPKQFLL